MDSVKKYCIYCYTNKINGKQYVGQTKNGLKRRAGTNGIEYVESGSYFGNAITKYGWDNFVPEILEEGLTLDEANEREEYWIAELNTLAPNGYNLAKGGNNHETHELTRKKISNSRMGYKYSEEHNRRQSERFKGEGNPRFGEHCSDETKEKISRANKGKTSYWKGKHLSEETKRKLSESKKGQIITDETREKLRKAHAGRKVSEEVRKKCGDTQRGKIISYECRDKISKTLINNEYNSKRVSQYTLDGQFVAEYPSIAEAARQTGAKAPHITQQIQGRYKSTGGFVWKLSNPNSQTISNVPRPVMQYSKDMILIEEFSSLNKASISTKISKQSIRRCCDGELETAGSYVWKYKEVA